MASEINKDTEILFNNQYYPVFKVLKQEFPNWYCYEHFIPSGKRVQVVIDNHAHYLTVHNHAYVFRWMMPQRPFLYSADDFYSDSDRQVGIYRFTPGNENIKMTTEQIKDIAYGVVEIDDAYLKKMNEAMQKAFTFFAFKIPVLDMRVDVLLDSDFGPLFDLHPTGKALVEVQNVIESYKRKQDEQRTKLLDKVKEQLSTYPNYLSILRDLLQEKLTIEEAIAQAGNKIFMKGF